MDRVLIREASSYIRSLPVNYKEMDSDRFNKIKLCSVSRADISTVHNVKVVQYYIYSGFKLLKEFCLPVQMREHVSVWRQWVKLQLFPSIKINEVFWVTDRWSRNYFHWVLECLPRILMFRTLGINVPLLIPAHIFKEEYVKSSLEDFSIKPVVYNFKQSVKVKKMYLPSHDSPCAFDPIFLNMLVENYRNIDQESYENPYRRVFVSRKSALKRKIINEDELITLLHEFEFQVVQMENLPFKKQRHLMRETNILLSIHGAGMTNMIFLPKGAKVVELHPDTERYNSCFYHLAAALGIDYYYSFEKGDHPNPQDANITVDLVKIKNLLNSL